MPGRPGGELIALQKNNILPTRFGEVIEDAATGDAATDHHDTRGAAQVLTQWVPPIQHMGSEYFSIRKGVRVLFHDARMLGVRTEKVL